MSLRVIVGVDAHLDSLALCAVAGSGKRLSRCELPNTVSGFSRAVRFATECGAGRFAIEGGGSHGRALRRFLTTEGFEVTEVPTWRLDQLRRRGRGRKDDATDAELAARVDLVEELPLTGRSELAEAIRVLRVQREGLVKQQTAAINRMRALLVEVDPARAAGMGRVRSRKTLQALSRAAYRGDLYRQTVAAAIRFEAKAAIERRDMIRYLEERLDQLLPPAGHALKEISGISTIGAATIIGETGDIERFATPAQFAAWSGTAPLDASSGRHQRHRLNRRGNRQVNRVLHTAILTQLRIGGPAADYIARRTQQGKTKNEAIRAATRHLTTKTWRTIKNHPQLT